MGDFQKTTERFIYKYMPINFFTLKALINNELYFGIPDEFNDPLDCKFRLKVDPPPSIESIKSFYESENLSPKEIERKIQKDNLSELVQFDIEESYVRNLRKEFAITCFSESFNSILMWSHYADKHRGLCLKFDWKIHENYFMGLKVQYSDKLPEVAYDGNGSLDSTSIFLSKIKHWDYEKEVRSIIKIEDGLQVGTFNPKALKGVIFGEKVSESNRNTILKAIKGNVDYVDVEIYDSYINSDKFTVEVIK